MLPKTALKLDLLKRHCLQNTPLEINTKFLLRPTTSFQRRLIFKSIILTSLNIKVLLVKFITLVVLNVAGINHLGYFCVKNTVQFLWWNSAHAVALLTSQLGNNVFYQEQCFVMLPSVNNWRGEYSYLLYCRE